MIKDENGTESYIGKVLSTYINDNYQLLSDVYGWAKYAVVWDDESKSPKSIIVDVWEYSRNLDIIVEVDATEEVRRAYANWLYNHLVRGKIEAAEQENAKITKGCTVEVVRGKVDRGLKGPVVGIISGTYGRYWNAKTEQKVGIATSDRKVKVEKYGKVYENFADVKWIWARNCDRLDAPPVDVPSIKEQVYKHVAGVLERIKTEHSWRIQDTF